ncbi:MAG: hypothetical protein ACYC8T_05800 [Myxococcaceae bacterium]
MRPLLFASMLLLACSPGPSGHVSDFRLPDVSPGSPRFGQEVSPRDYLDRVSGWYFTKTT